MNKPEFPKPTLIREDFMPEKDITTEYRIKKITKGVTEKRDYGYLEKGIKELSK